MNPCVATRLLVPAFLVGLAVATFAGSDTWGWIAASVTVAVLAVVSAVRRTPVSCTLAGPATPPCPTRRAASTVSTTVPAGARTSPVAASTTGSASVWSSNASAVEATSSTVNCSARRSVSSTSWS